MSLEIPEMPSYDEIKVMVGLTDKQADTLIQIGVEYLLDPENYRLKSWLNNKWVTVTPQNVATLTAKLSELAKANPEYKNMATRVTKLLNESISQQWSWLQNRYEGRIRDLQKVANGRDYTIEYHIDATQYGFTVGASVDGDKYRIRSLTIVPVTAVIDGIPCVRWIYDNGGMYLTMGGVDNKRQYENGFDDLQTAVEHATVALKQLVAEWEQEQNGYKETARAILAQIGKDGE